MRLTKRERIIEHLQAQGFMTLTYPSHKYIVMAHKLNIYGRKYFIGKHGAVRAGSNIGSSVSVTHHFVNV